MLRALKIGSIKELLRLFFNLYKNCKRKEERKIYRFIINPLYYAECPKNNRSNVTQVYPRDESKQERFNINIRKLIINELHHSFKVFKIIFQKIYRKI